MTPPHNLSGASDQELVAWACKGREDAYGELLRRHHRPVYALIHRLVRDHDLAEDLTQDTFVKAFGALEGRLRRRRLGTVPRPRHGTPRIA